MQPLGLARRRRAGITFTRDYRQLELDEELRPRRQGVRARYRRPARAAGAAVTLAVGGLVLTACI